MEADGSIFRTHTGKGERRTQVLIEREEEEYIWRDNELSMDDILKIKLKTKTKNQS